MSQRCPRSRAQAQTNKTTAARNPINLLQNHAIFITSLGGHISITSTKAPAFFSYARRDSAFASRLAADLKQAGANVWLDQLDIRPGRQSDREVENALHACSEVIVVLTPAAVESKNVMDEISFALDEEKTVIPLLLAPCRVPFRLRRVPTKNSAT